jgi:hypothetical protein
MTKIGFQEGNITRLFILSEAYDNSPFPPSFQVGDVAATGLSVPVQTRQVHETYGQGIFASFISFRGFEFYFDNTNSNLPDSTVLISTTLEVKDNLGFFLRLSSEGGLIEQNYPFDRYTFGLGLLVFNKDSNASVSITFPDSISYASTSPLVPTDQSKYFSLSLTGYGRLDPWNLDSEKVSEYATSNIVVVRNEFERTLIPMLLVVSFMLLVPIVIFAARNMRSESVTVFLALVVLDIGIFEKLGSVKWLVWTPNILVVLDLFTGAALMICSVFLTGRNNSAQPSLAEKQGPSKRDLARYSIIGFISLWRVFFGSLFGQFLYFWFALRDNWYLSIGITVVVLALVSVLVYVTADTLYRNRRSIASLYQRLKSLPKTLAPKKRNHARAIDQ